MANMIRPVVGYLNERYHAEMIMGSDTEASRGRHAIVWMGGNHYVFFEGRKKIGESFAADRGTIGEEFKRAAGF